MLPAVMEAEDDVGHERHPVARQPLECRLVLVHTGIEMIDLANGLLGADHVAKIEREVMDNLRDLAKFEMPKKIVLVEEDFTVDNGRFSILAISLNGRKPCRSAP